MQVTDSDATGIGLLFGLCFSIFGLIAFVLYIASLFWVYIDAQNRGKTGCLWLLLVFFTWPLGVIAYFILRDQTVRL